MTWIVTVPPCGTLILAAFQSTHLLTTGLVIESLQPAVVVVTLQSTAVAKGIYIPMET